MQATAARTKKVLSPYLVHHAKQAGRAKVGSKVRDASALFLCWGAPPSNGMERAKDRGYVFCNAIYINYLPLVNSTHHARIKGTNDVLHRRQRTFSGW